MCCELVLVHRTTSRENYRPIHWVGIGAKLVSVTYGQLEKVFVCFLRDAVRERAVVLAVVPALLASRDERE